MAVKNAHGVSSRWRWQYRLSSLLLLTAVVAAALGWKMNQVRQKREAVRALLASGAHVTYAWVWDRKHNHRFFASPPGPEWLRRDLGQDFFANVIAVSMASRGPEEEEMRLDHAAMKEDAAPRVRMPIPDLSPLQRLPGLQFLSLSSYRLGNREMAELADLPDLSRIVFNSCEIDPDAIVQLERMHQLRSLEFNSPISNEHLSRLKAALGSCMVEGPDHTTRSRTRRSRGSASF